MTKLNKKILQKLIENEVSSYIFLLLEQAAAPETPPPAPEPASEPAPAPTPDATPTPAPAAPPPTPDATGTPAEATPPDAAGAPPDAGMASAPAGAPSDTGAAPPAPDAGTAPPDAAAAGAPADASGTTPEGTPEEETFGIKSIEAPQQASPEQNEKIQFNNKLLDLVKTKREEYKNLTNPDQLIWNELKTELINSKKGLEEAKPILTTLSVSTDQIIKAVAHNLAVFILLK